MLWTFVVSTGITLLAAIVLVILLATLYQSHLRLPQSRPPATATLSSGAYDGSRVQLRVMTQNLWLHHLVVAPQRSYRVSEFVAHIDEQQYHVVALQEVFLLRIGPFVLSHLLHQLISEMDSIGYHYWTDPTLSLPRYFGQNSGLMIFSRVPFAEQESSVFEQSDEILNNKGFIAIRIDHQTHSQRLDSLHIVCTHFDSRRTSTKLLQAQQLGQRLHDMQVFQVVGDFNICRMFEHDTYSRLLDSIAAGVHDIDNATPERGTYRPKPMALLLILQTLTFGWFRPEFPNVTPPMALDHMFYTRHRLQASEQQIIDWRCDSGMPVSDHYGVISTITLLDDDDTTQE
jgi:endonuclease/exonuclease/phosphatase family metal-dependent hydrolase